MGEHLGPAAEGLKSSRYGEEGADSRASGGRILIGLTMY